MLTATQLIIEVMLEMIWNMRCNLIFLTSMFIFNAGTYAVETKLIPDGIYLNDSDEVIIESNNIHFKVVVKERKIDKNYKYGVEADGVIHVYGLVSTDFSVGVGFYQWFWDGEKIVKLEPASKMGLFFVKK